MLCIWWNQLGVISYKLLKPNETITGALDIAPSDYPSFQLMTHGLSEQNFVLYGDTHNSVDSWIASKGEEFFPRGIRMLPKRRGKLMVRSEQ
ncbi:hypothetical protein TNCV_165411 [Trichonephila clavipes]|nr:hypothetical protein TNCV_165411 [Trichonephila clavipes]